MVFILPECVHDPQNPQGAGNGCKMLATTVYIMGGTWWGACEDTVCVSIVLNACKARVFQVFEGDLEHRQRRLEMAGKRCARLVHIKKDLQRVHVRIFKVWQLVLYNAWCFFCLRRVHDPQTHQRGWKWPENAGRVFDRIGWTC